MSTEESKQPEQPEQVDIFGDPANNGDSPKSIFDLFESDATMEEQGIVVDFGDYGQFKIARAGGGNQRFAETFQRKFRPYKRQQQAGTLPESVAVRLLAEIYAEAIFKDWKNVFWKDGKELPFTRENVIKLMLALPDLFKELREASAEASSFRRMDIEEIAKNS